MRVTKHISIKKVKDTRVIDTQGRQLNEHSVLSFTSPSPFLPIFDVDGDTVSVRLKKETLEKLGKAMIKLAKGMK